VADPLKASLLIVDDEPDFSFLIAEWLRAKGLDVATTVTADEAERHVLKSRPDLILIDVMLENSSGIELVRKLKASHHDIPIVMVSAFGDTQNIVSAMKAGASDYVQKPVDYGELWAKISYLLGMRTSELTRQKLLDLKNFGVFIGESPKSRQLIHEVSKVANSDATVLLRGESGVGKSLIAQLIHEHSPRKNHELVTINCAAIPENLLESELFGHEKGSFTGALRDKIGKFEYADKGTIFLDEIGDLSQELQVKLLRVLQGHEFERVGGLKTIHVDVRVIAATNRNLEKAVQENKFREDLFYRLNVLPVHVPPLRERREDVANLIAHFLSSYCSKAGKRLKPLNPFIMERLVNYDWPGNVRELQNVVERAVVLGAEPEFKMSDFVLSHTRLTPPDLAPAGEASRPSPQPDSVSGRPVLPVMSLKDLEYRRLIEAIEKSRGNVAEIARLLGIGRNTVYRRLKKHNISLE
jgi:DNA-binding NtrC family response regulator